MIGGMLNTTAVPLLEQVVRFSEQRHKVLVGNIANIDTPGYKPRDLPVEKFQQALHDAMVARKQQEQPIVGSLSSSRSGDSNAIDQFFTPELFQADMAEAQNVTFQDGNNRSIEWAMMELQKNARMQRFAIEVINSQLNMLQAVISERP